MNTTRRQLFFHAGREPHLSNAEVVSVLESLQCSVVIDSVSAHGVLCTVDCIDDCASLQDRLGGTIRIIEVVRTVPHVDIDGARIVSVLTDVVPDEGKLHIGYGTLSLDGSGLGYRRVHALMMDVKREMRDGGRSVRLVAPRGRSRVLSSASVIQNNLLRKGAEVVLLSRGKNVLIGCTQAVQDIEGYVRRDESRPVRDLKVGMMPLKLAQMMLNLAECSTGSRILDPFCGMGTIVQEGIRLGFSMVGSDIDQKMVSATQKNMDWYCSQAALEQCDWRVVQSDAASVHRVIGGSVEAIVSEGTLGPLLSSRPTERQQAANFTKLSSLYRQVLPNLANILARGGRLVMTFPVYFSEKSDDPLLLPVLDEIEKMGYSLHTYDDSTALTHGGYTRRGTMVYRRPDQFVGREVVVLTRNI